VSNPTLAAATSATIVLTAVAFATFAARMTGWEGPVQQRAGFHCPADSMSQRVRLLSALMEQASSSSPTNGGGGSSGSISTIARSPTMHLACHHP
jgi:hypothetical protein